MAIIILPPGSTSTDLQNAISNAGSGDIIEISNNITITENVEIPVGRSITIRSTTGNNWVLTQVILDARHVWVRGSLILQNITLDGGRSGGGIIVDNNANLTINTGTIIRNCFAYNGSVVLVVGGSFNMVDGEISNNKAINGGGVFIVGGNFNMAGGEISDNEAGGGGGVFVTRNSAFTMHGGAIRRNEAVYNGGGVSIYHSTFNMQSGEISENITGMVGGGVSIWTTTSNISNSHPINPRSIFVMTGGEISRNMAEGRFDWGWLEGWGGGVYVRESEFVMSDGEINNNIAQRGGGVGTEASLFNMKENGRISNNTANENGGGIYLVPVLASRFNNALTMNGGIIRNNMAHNGGGIFNSDSSLTDISGTSEIINNKATNNGEGQGGGVYTEGFNHLVITGPRVRFANNRADFATEREPINDAVYATHILNMEGNWTAPFRQGYNNFDINQNGTRIEPEGDLLKIMLLFLTMFCRPRKKCYCKDCCKKCC